MHKMLPGRRALSTKQMSSLMNRVENLSAKFRLAMREQNYAQALVICEAVLASMPHNLSVLSDYALVLMRLGDYKKSYKIYLKIWASPQRQHASETWLDGLTEVCGWLDRPDEVREYGNLSLTQSDLRFSCNPGLPIPSTTPKPFNRQYPAKNIIAFSLFGNQPRYCETLVENVHAAKELYPSWTCRIWLDDSVPRHVWQRLEQAGAELVDMSQEKEIQPTLWRFLVLDDVNVDRYIIRDADSLLSEREVAAVEEWLSSTDWFHHMRDYFTHTELLLAGMWGGCSGVFSNVAQQMRTFIAKYTGAERFTDQAFLKSVLWPTVRNSIMNHDELFGFHGARPFPSHVPIRWQTNAFHVGSNVGFQRMAGLARNPKASTQALDLIIDAQRYAYSAPVVNGEWSIAMPFFLVDAWKENKISIEAV